MRMRTRAGLRAGDGAGGASGIVASLAALTTFELSATLEDPTKYTLVGSEVTTMVNQGSAGGTLDRVAGRGMDYIADSGINALPGMESVAGTLMRMVTSKTLADLNMRDAYHVFLVMVIDDLDGGTGTQSREFFEVSPDLYNAFSNNGGTLAHAEGGGNQATTGAGSLVVGTPYILELSWDGTNHHARLNKGSEASAASSGTLVGTGTLEFGGDTSTTRALDGKIAGIFGHGGSKLTGATYDSVMSTLATWADITLP